MIHKLLPHGYKVRVEKLLESSGSKKSTNSFIDTTFIVSIIVGVVAGFFSGELMLLMGVFGFVGMFALLHGMVILTIEKRARFVETVLPDALQLMAANSRAGHIPSRALMLSARKEFGPLCEAIKIAGKEMLTGKSLDESLMVIPKFIKSDILEKSIKLIIEGSKSGGQLAELLEQNAEDIRRKQGIAKEVRANVTMYVIFIGFAGCVGAPMLYALSGFLTSTISKLGEIATMPEEFASQTTFLQFSGLTITDEFLFYFSIIAIFITTFFAGLLIGSISTGSEKGGIKYTPILMLVAYAIFFAARIFIEVNFGTMLTI